jgi:nucleotide-binding universal stress UspA family protein
MAYRNLLVLCDASAESDEAVVAASELARRDRAQLTIAAVAELEAPSRRCGFGTHEWNEVLRDAASADLDRAAKLVDSPAHFTVLCGKPGPAIVECADRLGCDAIMLPSPPRRLLSRMVHRDQAPAVRRLATCAVLRPR